MKFKLSQDEREALIDVLKSDGWSPLLKCIEQLVQRQEELLLSYDLGNGADRLIHEKARVEGARRVQADIQQIKKHLVQVAQ